MYMVNQSVLAMAPLRSGGIEQPIFVLPLPVRKPDWLRTESLAPSWLVLTVCAVFRCAAALGALRVMAAGHFHATEALLGPPLPGLAAWRHRPPLVPPWPRQRAGRQRGQLELVSWQRGQPELVSRQRGQPELVSWQRGQPELAGRQRGQPELVSWQRGQPELASWQREQPEVVGWGTEQWQAGRRPHQPLVPHAAVKKAFAFLRRLPLYRSRMATDAAGPDNSVQTVRKLRFGRRKRHC